MLTNGDVVPADARVLPGFASSLETDEALLTGESLPVAKKTELMTEVDCPVGDKKNMVSVVIDLRALTSCRLTLFGCPFLSVLGLCRFSSDQGTSSLHRRRHRHGHRAWEDRRGHGANRGCQGDWLACKVVQDQGPPRSRRNDPAPDKAQQAGLHPPRNGAPPRLYRTSDFKYVSLRRICNTDIVALVRVLQVVASTAFVDVPMSIATYAVATAVSILPASLIAVVSLTLATASRELARKNALVRRMDAIESLSAVTDICSDKTGTITVGKMVVKKAWIPVNTAFPTDGRPTEIDVNRGQAYSAESGSDPFYPRGTVRALPRTRLPGRSLTTDTSGTTLSNSEEDDDEDEDDDLDSEDVIRPSEMEDNFKNMILCSSLNNMATIHKGSEDRWEAAGDATEIALQVFAHKLGHGKPHLTHPKKQSKGDKKAAAAAAEQHALSPVQSRASDHGAAIKTKVAMDGHYEILVEHPFDSNVKRMSTVWKYEDAKAAEKADLLVFMKGAV